MQDQSGERVMPQAGTLTELQDKQLLHDNMMEYCRGIDRMDVDLMKSTYWSDSFDDHAIYVGGGHEYCEAAIAYKDRLHSVNHHVSNVLIRLDGDRAERETRFFLVTVYKEPAVTTFKGGRYRDLCEKRGDEWRVLFRTVIWDWCDQRPTVNGWSVVGQPQESNWGGFYPDDPIYGSWDKVEHRPYPREDWG